jgi:hypothetical protein
LEFAVSFGRELNEFVTDTGIEVHRMDMEKFNILVKVFKELLSVFSRRKINFQVIYRTIIT